jgi:hypothetical protein
MLQIPNPLTIRREETASDKEQYAEQKDNRAAQLRQAKALNWITAIGVGVAVFALCGLIYNVRQSRRAMEINERAWVVPTKATTEQNDKGDFSFKIPFTNTGRSPALLTHAWIGTTPNLSTIAKSDPIAAGDGHDSYVLAPDGVGNTSTATFTAESLEPIRHGAHLYIYGTIVYQDVFGKSHWTQFCFYPGEDLKGFGPCPKHNTTHDEQPRPSLRFQILRKMFATM